MSLRDSRTGFLTSDAARTTRIPFALPVAILFGLFYCSIIRFFFRLLSSYSRFYSLRRPPYLPRIILRWIPVRFIFRFDLRSLVLRTAARATRDLRRLLFPFSHRPEIFRPSLRVVCERERQQFSCTRNQNSDNRTTSSASSNRLLRLVTRYERPQPRSFSLRRFASIRIHLIMWYLIMVTA